MAQPTCPKCNGTMFEVNELKPAGSNFRFVAINCTNCGCIVGVLDHYNIGELIYVLAAKLKIDLDR